MRKRAVYLILPAITLFLEMLPYGAVLNFANPEGEPWRETYSYFSMVPFGYANFTPFFTAIITTAIILLMFVYCITGKCEFVEKTKKVLILAIIFSFGSLIFGIRYYSFVALLISLSLIFELMLLHFTVKVAEI